MSSSSPPISYAFTNLPKKIGKARIRTWVLVRRRDVIMYLPVSYHKTNHCNETNCDDDGERYQ